MDAQAIPYHYNYIIAGAGSAGLSLAWHIIHSELPEARILIIDRNLEPRNDKTWCFWSKRGSPFEHLIHKKWRRTDVFVYGNHYKGTLSEYRYHCIRSGNFRGAILNELASFPNVTLLNAPVEEMGGDDDSAWLRSGEDTFHADFIFQSCFPPPIKKEPDYPLIQHFLGWEITANSAVFDPTSFTLMDFDESFTEGVAFMYTLPWSESSALLEYTIFSKAVSPFNEYEEKLELYLFNKYNLKRIDYTIDRTEFGEIPMEDSVYESWYATRVLNIGRQGGLVKPSTGYAYRRIQEHSVEIVKSLIRTGRPDPAPRSRSRFRRYDLWLLEIMYDYPRDALRVFHQLFKNNSFDDIFRFLGEESHIGQDLKIMSSVPYRPFFRAMWKTKTRMLNFKF